MDDYREIVFGDTTEICWAWELVAVVVVCTRLYKQDQARQYPTMQEGGSHEIPFRLGQPVFFKGACGFWETTHDSVDGMTPRNAHAGSTTGFWD